NHSKTNQQRQKATLFNRGDLLSTSLASYFVSLSTSHSPFCHRRNTSHRSLAYPYARLSVVCCAISNRTIQNAARPGIISAANIDLFDNQFEIPTALVTPTPPSSQSTRSARITSKRPPINS
ncbi:unnamed protein product, partial [Ixodes pacificus]